MTSSPRARPCLRSFDRSEHEADNARTPTDSRTRRARGTPILLKQEANMERKTAKDFDQELLDLFDQYVHGGIDRRGFLDRAAKFAVGGVTAATLLDALSPRFAEAQQVSKDDKRIKAEFLEYSSPQGYGKMRGYL